MWPLMNKLRLVLEKKQRTSFQHFLRNTFLPVGYPKSVHPNYWPYTKYQFLHATFGSACGVISTQSILMAMNLSSSIPLAATLNWILKDGLGQLGGVAYVSRFGHLFDSNTKRFRYISCLSMQLACLLEIFTLAAPSHFLLIAGISNIAKNVAWLANSATRAKVHNSFAWSQNLADVTGKSGSQNTTAGVLGTFLGICATTIAETPINLLLAFLPLSVLSVVCNYKSTLYIVNNILNQQKIELVLRHSEFSVEKICEMETFVRKYSGRITVDPKISSLNPKQMDQLLNPTFDARYSIVDGPTILFHKEAESKDIIRGMLHCHLMLSGISAAEALNYLDKEETLLLQKLKDNNWDLDTIYISDDKRRIRLEKNV